MRSCAFALLVSLALSTAHAVVSLIPSSPGKYQYIDRAQIERNKIDWSALVQQQDYEAYQRATTQAEAAYKSLYERLMTLRQLHIDSQVARKRLLSAGELSTAIAEFKKEYAQLQTQLAVVAVLKDVWSGLGEQPNADDQTQRLAEYVYSKGSLNLKSFTDVYTKGMDDMLREANDLTYSYSNNAGEVITKAGEGLFEPSTIKTPAYILQALNVARENGEFTRHDIEFNLAPLSIEVGRHMAEFVNSNNLRFYWMNKMQEDTRAAWADSLQTKARLVKYVRAVYCTAVGVPALDIPRLRSWNLGYLERGSPMRIVAKAEFDEAAQRSIMMRFAETFQSIRSQAGEFNDQGGVAGYIHRVNSKLTWQNETQAYLSIMNILNDMYQDELDLQSDPLHNCAKVRERYYERFGSIRNNTKWNQTVEVYLQGGLGGTDATLRAFRKAGEVLLTKGRYNIEYRNLLMSEPQLSLVNQTLDLDLTIR